MDNELLFSLLKEHNRLIIPEFGAFLKKELGDSTIIIFTPFLKKDDGVLKIAISEHLSVDESDAATILNEYVNDLQSRLKSQGTYYIDGLGLFKHDSNGAMTFIYEPRKEKPAEESKTSPTPAPEQQMPTREPIVTQPINQQFIDQTHLSRNSAATSTVERPTPQVTPRQIPVNGDTKPFAQPFGGMKQPIAPQPQSTVPRPVQNQQPLPRAVTPKPAFAQPTSRPMSPTQQQPRSAQPTQRPGQRPVTTNKQRPPVVKSAQNPGQKKKIFQKADLWLLIAIVAALIVLGLILFANNTPEQEIILHPSPAEISQFVTENSCVPLFRS